MRYKAFKLEEYFAKYEFLAKYFLCCSDAESFTMSEILKLADHKDQEMWDNLDLCYGETNGLHALRQAIIEAFYPELSAENILISAGTEDAIFCTFNALITAQDHVIVMTPCYQSLLEIPKMLTHQVTEMRLDQEWCIDIDNIQNALQLNTKCIVMNFPHNPTGQVLEQSKLNALVELCHANKIWLFSDEVYRLLGMPNNPWSTPVAAAYNMGLSVSGMSKSFGMGGLRIGWIACQDQDLLNKIKNVKYYTSLSNNLPSEIL
jgi:aspartate/methionine/tyrosine aminotransferase